MKLLDPFAGYRFARGHAFFHVALFITSWMVPHFGHDDSKSSEEIEDAFQALRWSHFISIFLAMIQAYADTPSNIDKGKKQDAEIDEEALTLVNNDSQAALRLEK